MLKGITIDNGGSELRYMDCDEGNEIFTLDKKVSTIDRDTFRVKENVEEFDIISIDSAPNPKLLDLYATGLGFFMYSGTEISMTKEKSSSTAWYQQVVIAVATDAIKTKRKLDEEGIDTSHEVFDYELITLIPVIEHSGDVDCANRLRNLLAGEYEVSFPAIQSGSKTVKFTLSKEKIGVLPEGIVCLPSLMKEIKPSDVTLIVDMGQVTMDLAIVKGVHLIGNSVASSEFAGGTLLKLMERKLSPYIGAVTRENCVEALTTDKFQINSSKTLSLHSEVEAVKTQFISNYIKVAILNQLEMSGLSPKNVTRFIPIGAGLSIKDASSGEYTLINKIIEEVGLINAEVRILNDNLRYVNITQAHNVCLAKYNKSMQVKEG